MLLWPNQTIRNEKNWHTFTNDMARDLVGDKAYLLKDR